MRKSFKYRAFPNGTQMGLFIEQLREACGLYNAALQERKEAWKIAKKSVNYYDQANQLKEIRAAGDLHLANFSCCQDILRRVDKTFKAFFKRRHGFPRFKSSRRFDSITFPSYGDGVKLLATGRLRAQGIGEIKFKMHRPIAGKIKTVALKRECGKMYVIFSVECDAEPLPTSNRMVGIDVGLDAFAVTSDGWRIENPRCYRKAQAKLRRAQRRVARRKKGSNRRRKAVLLIQKIHQHVFNQRNDFHHKLSRRIVNEYGVICVEDLNFKGLAGGMLAKSVHDVGWATFFSQIAHKAESAGRELIAVDPRGTSQRCICGAANRKTLADRTHVCAECGLVASRDQVSSLEILRLGLSRKGITWAELKPCVPLEAVAL